MKHQYLKNVVTLQLDENRCTGCGMCIEVCPHEVLEFHGKRVQIRDRDACIECGACARNCSFSAITVNAGVGCASAIIRGALRNGEPTCGCSTDGNDSCCC
ncbi:MAG TPA: ferredoxin [Deltaproteobacteria bacterium]|nr:ferredoxin [Deltaproteobacteria bacterium]